MSNSFVKNDIHIVFHTKSKATVIPEGDLERVLEYIGGIVKSMGATLYVIGGRPDHVHMLVSLPKTISLSELVRTVKANSRKWIKSLHPYYGGFCWQDGYGAFSVSASMIQPTIDYIRNQEEHHRVKTFREELRAILDKCGIEYDERYL